MDEQQFGSRDMRKYTTLIIAFVAVLSAPARADWVDDAWNEEIVLAYGNPSITLHASDGVSLTLPSAVLKAGLRTGLTVEQAVAVFLGRYAPSQCSHVLNMNVPHLGMRVVLRLEAFKPVTSAERAVGVSHAFEVAEERRDMTIDYAPAKVVRCVEPPIEAF